jgi:ketosteroid isomerase-like protein
MSRENLELHRRAVDAFNRGDFDALLDLIDEDIEVFSRLVIMEGGYQGHEGVRRWWQNIFDAFPDWNAEAVEVRDLGGRTLASLRIGAHGGQSGVPVDQNIWQLAEWRDDKVVRMSSHATEAEALEAVGLVE